MPIAPAPFMNSIPTFWAKLAAAITAEGVEFTASEDGVVETILGEKVEISVKEETVGASHDWSVRRPTGKLVAHTCVAGGSHKHEQAKARKGDFDYMWMARSLITGVRMVKESDAALQATETAERAAKAVAEKLTEEFFSFETVTPPADCPWEKAFKRPTDADIALKATARGVFLVCEKPMTESQLRIMLAAAREAGLVR